MSVLAPVRIVHETTTSSAECPTCGTRLSLEVAGLTWRVRGPADVAERLMLQLGGLEREELHVLLLNTKNAVLAQELAYAGNISTAVVRVGELFTAAVRRQAAGLILVHNHPSGDPSPSADDLHLTSQVVAAGRLLDVEVLDHIIVGRTRYVSLRDQGVSFIPAAGRAAVGRAEAGRAAAASDSGGGDGPPSRSAAPVTRHAVLPRTGPG